MQFYKERALRMIEYNYMLKKKLEIKKVNNVYKKIIENYKQLNIECTIKLIHL